MKLPLFKVLCNARYPGYCVVSWCVISYLQKENRFLDVSIRPISVVDLLPPIALLISTQVTTTKLSVIGLWLIGH